MRERERERERCIASQHNRNRMQCLQGTARDAAGRDPAFILVLVPLSVVSFFFMVKQSNPVTNPKYDLHNRGLFLLPWTPPPPPCQQPYYIYLYCCCMLHRMWLMKGGGEAGIRIKGGGNSTKRRDCEGPGDHTIALFKSG